MPIFRTGLCFWVMFDIDSEYLNAVFSLFNIELWNESEKKINVEHIITHGKIPIGNRYQVMTWKTTTKK